MTVVALRPKLKKHLYTADDLRQFEEEIAAIFAEGKIRSPIHLAGGNEEQLIEIFDSIDRSDWVCAGWRSHLHCLLHGVPPDELKAAIIDGQSVSLCFPKHKVFCSGIVGGIAPIAVGLAWSEKKRAEENLGHCARVHVFLGDMAFEAGIVHEATKYAARHDLPIRFIVEDNHKSVGTPTQLSWGNIMKKPDVIRYHYELTRPHSGVGRWVRFDATSD